MKPIINPLWIYLIDVLDKLDMISKIVCVLATIVLGLAIAECMDIDVCTCPDKKFIGFMKKFVKMGFAIVIVSLVLTIAIPSKNTMYTMMTLEQVTPDNIKIVGEAGENIIDYITEKIDQVVNDKHDNKE